MSVCCSELILDHSKPAERAFVFCTGYIAAAWVVCSVTFVSLSVCMFVCLPASVSVLKGNRHGLSTYKLVEIHFWPTVLSVVPLAHYVVCRLSVVVCRL